MHTPNKNSSKGDNGVLHIIGGSKKYHGAAVLAIMAARRFVDLIYFTPGEHDPFLISAIKNIPEVIISRPNRPVDVVLYGVGLDSAKPKLPRAKKTVVDGDGLKKIKNFSNLIITPNEREFNTLFGLTGNKKNVEKIAREKKCLIVKKGPIDIISDGKNTFVNKTHNAGLTKGGTGDVLAGLLAALCCNNDSFEAAKLAVYAIGHTSNLLKKRYGYNYCASDVANKLGETLWKLKI